MSFNPDWRSPPGATIGDLSVEKNLTLPALAKLLGRTENFTLKLLVGGVRLSRTMAKLLSDKLGGTEEFWINREANFRKPLRRKR